MRKTGSLFAILACVLSLGLPVPADALAGRRAGPSLERPVHTATTAVLRGRAPARALVRVQARRASGWRTVRKVRARRNGVWRVAVRRAPVSTRYRAVANRRASRARAVAPVAPSTTTPAVPPVPADACGTQPQKQDGSYWSCTFLEEFDGTELDSSKWLVQETWYSGMSSGNLDCFVDDGETVRLDGGRLLLTARRNLASSTCASPLGGFTSTSTAAAVSTRDRFSQTYGRFAFRAKLPATAGIPGPHSALWLYPERHYYGAWPASGEIDVAEWFSARPENVYPSVHYTGENPLLSSGYECAVATPGEFHTYVVEWTPTSMRFLYDGVACYEHAWAPTDLLAPQPFDRPFNVVLTQVWGSLWNAPTEATPDVARLEVDWVRVWQ